MKRLYVRRGTLLILALILMLVLGAGYMVTPKLMASSIENQEQAGPIGASLVLKERLIKFFPWSEEARWEVYELADNLLQGEARVIIGPNFTSGGGRIGAGLSVPMTVEEVILYLERVAKAQIEEIWKYNCYEKLAQLYRSNGNLDKAEYYFALAAEGFEEENQDYRAAEVSSSLSNLYLEKGESQKALALIEPSMKKYPNQKRAEFLSQLGDAYFELKDYTKAEQYYRESLLEVEKRWDEFQKTTSEKESNINATLEDQPGYKHSKSRLEQLATLKEEGPVGKGQVKGKIRSGSDPMANVIVYLINEKEHDGSMGNLDRIAALPSVKTDAHGKFEFNGVEPGKYFIALGILPEDLEGLGRFKGLETFQVDTGKITEQRYVFQPTIKIAEPIGQMTFEQGKGFNIIWEKVEQAATYNLHITLKLENGYVSTVYRQNLKGNSYFFNLQGLALREMNFVTWSDKEGLAPSAILGSFYPGAEIYLGIEAIDEQGRSISDSEGYVLQLNGNYPSLLIKGKDEALSAGDKLVLERKYKDAIKAYEDDLRFKPHNPEILLSLARIYNHYGKGDRPDVNEPGFKNYSDPKKALEYYTQLLEVSREKFIVEEAASTAVRTNDDEKALALFDEIESVFERNSFWYHLMGELYFRTGQTEKALSYYFKYLDGKKEFVDLGPVIALLYQNEIDSAIKLLQDKEYSQRLRYNSQGNSLRPADIGTIVSNLKKYQAGTKSKLKAGAFREYLIEIMSISGSERSEQISAFNQKVSNLGEKDILVLVLKELVKDRL